MLCQFAHNFPPFVASFLEREKGLRRRFREETVTDMLMASLAALQPLGIHVQFPHEPTTGADMDWIFVAPKQTRNRRYFRLLLQAKRSQFAHTKKGYWFYNHLDHDKGKQAQTLLAQAGPGSAATSTVPLYLLYHPSSGLAPASSTAPSVDGINIMFANLVAPVVNGGCARKEKRVERWRPHFFKLSDLFCLSHLSRPARPEDWLPSEFVFQQGGAAVLGTEGFHPEVVVRRIRSLQEHYAGETAKSPQPRMIAAGENIPDDIGRLLSGQGTLEDRRRLERPRVVFSTDATLAKVG